MGLYRCGFTGIICALAVLAQVNNKGVSAAPAAGRQRIVSAYASLSLSFEANIGQCDPEVKFLSRGAEETPASDDDDEYTDDFADEVPSVPALEEKE